MWFTRNLRPTRVKPSNKRSLSVHQQHEVAHNDDQKWSNAKPFSSIPGPSKLGLLRSFLPGGKYHNLNFLEMNKAMYKEYGPILKFPEMLGKSDVIFAFDPDDMKTVFRNEGQWPVRRVLESFNFYRNEIRPDVFKKGAGLANNQGESWAKLRKLVNPIFMKPDSVKAYIPKIDTVAGDFIRKIRAIRDVRNEMPDDFRNELHKWSLESIALIALEHRLDLITNAIDPENQALINAIKDFFVLAFEIDIMPSIWKYYKTPKFYRMMDALEVMTNISKKHVDRAIDRFANEKAKNESHEDSVLRKILQIDKDYAVLMALDMILAGTDTTAASAACLWYNLAKHQKVQDKLREEILTVLPNAEESLTPESLTSLPYMRACLKETMRMTPIFVGNDRAAGCDLYLQGYHIPKGTNIVLCSSTLLQDERFFDRADEFMPERFLKQTLPDCPNNVRNIHPFLMLPFGFGARACLGRRFAEMEIEILTIRLLRNFKIEWNHGPMTFSNGLVMTPASKLKYKITDL